MKRIKNKIRILLVALISSMILAACADSYLELEKVKTDDIAPGTMTINQVIPKPGALEIHFTLAQGDADVAQIAASYTNKKGEKMEFTVSRYSSSILVEGFTGTDEVTINMVSIDNSGNQSENTVVKGTPLLSPIESALETMEVSAAFGGVKIDWENLSGDLLVIHVLTEDTLQIKGETTFTEDASKRIYTQDTLNNKTYAYVRQYPDTEQKFGFVIADKWGNRTDTLIGHWTPYREDPIEYQHINALNVFQFQYASGQSKDYASEGIIPETGIQKDGLFYSGAHGPKTLFDNKLGGNQFHCTKFTENMNDGDDSTTQPVQTAYATYDLNVDTRLSRMKIYWRSYFLYAGTSVKHFRFWGTNDENADRFSKFPETWTLIGEYIAPEAIDRNNLTADEKEAATGMEFSIEDDNINPDAQPKTNFRYLRIEMLDSYDNTRMQYTWNEIYLWGQIENKYYE
ncbi:DUF4959 domain-containing protein [Puteibacter caeruleilacunae]|nr:DUF4959 domain-containing protein [Puteibacter caeruleilacunae]